MLKIPESAFLWIACQNGAEPALKQELKREHPELRFAFSRPGFVTFKRMDEKPFAPEFTLRSIFARAYGLSFGKAGNPEEVVRFARALDAGPESLTLHVFERDLHRPGEEPMGFVPNRRAQDFESSIRELDKSNGRAFRSSRFSPEGGWVMDVIGIEEDQWWMGMHLQLPGRAPDPGGRPRIELPDAAPSRAYLKLEEAIRWSSVPLRENDVAVEIGSAPGGASYALLNRGIQVIGIDPADMSPTVMAMKGFRHLALPVERVRRDHLPSSVQWLLLDMNVVPEVSLDFAGRLAESMRETLLGAMLTVKLNQWKLAERIPDYLDRVRSFGMVRVRATQLPSNRQEIFMYGLTRKGLARRS